MVKVLPQKKSLRVAVILGALAIVLAGGYAGARFIAWPYFKTWRDNRATNVARELYNKGDYPSALIAVRNALQKNRNNLEAAKLGVEITEKQDSPQAFVYQQLLTGVQPTLENKIKLIRIAVQYRAFTQAQEMIDKMGVEASQSAEFFELAAQVAQRMNQGTKAKFFLMSLVKLRPDDKKARLDLAQLRMVDGFSDNKPAIRSEIRTLATESPELRQRALTLLLADAIDAKNEADAIAFAQDLSALPNVDLGTQTMIAEAYRLFAPKRFHEFVKKLQLSADTPEKVVMVVNYLANRDLAAEMRTWLDGLPDTLKSIESVQVTYSFCLLKLEAFAALETFLRGVKWTENEFVRQALLAYRYRQLNDVAAFNEAWKLALIEVGNSPRKIQILLTQVQTWRWQDQKIELLWKKFNLDPSDKALRQQLAIWERGKNETAKLNRLFGRVAELDPTDLDYRNNYAYTCLLLNINLERAHNEAREVYELNRKNPFYTATYSLSLYKQGKVQEALQVFESMGAAVISAPERILIHSILLIANGRIDEGVDQSASLKLDQFLPEERRLLNETAAIISRTRREQAGASRLAALAAAGASGNAERKSWLATLPATFRKSTVQLELADSLYANDDFSGLETALKSEKWEDNDFLRQVLLAYALRNQGKDADARSTWRIAVSAIGTRPANLSVVEDMTERWGWTAERMEILNRIFQRDALDTKAFEELVGHYTKAGQTSELARIHDLRVGADAADNEIKTRFAYYSLLINSNVSKAQVLALETHGAAPTNIFAAKVYAYSLLKQSRAADAWRALEKLPDNAEAGIAQLALLKAAIAVQQNNLGQAEQLLTLFDEKTALPEEIALAKTLSQTIAQKKA